MRLLARSVAAGASVVVCLSLADRYIHRKLCKIAGMHVP